MLIGLTEWSHPVWITLDHEVVVKQPDAIIAHEKLPETHDNNNICQSLIPAVQKRAEDNIIKVTWTKGLADQHTSIRD